MKLNLITKPVLTIIPSITLIPIIINILLGIHFGGISAILEFVRSSISPSLDPIIIASAWSGIQVTFSIAFISWLFSLIIGIFLGLISSDLFSYIYNLPISISKIIRFLLLIPRSIHELIWGLILLQIFGLNPYVAIISIVIPFSCLMAKITRSQLEVLGKDGIITLKKIGASKNAILISGIIPKMMPIIIRHGGYRLECALRSAILLGIFGLGGIGNELKLSIYSLNFDEMWTYLWTLCLVMIILERVVMIIQKVDWYRLESHKIWKIHSIIILFLILCLYSISEYDLTIFANKPLQHIDLINIKELYKALNDLNLIKLSSETLTLTILASGIAIGMPPMIISLWPTKLGQELFRFCWLICRLIPIPLSAFLFLLCINPSIYLAALALGINNMGIMGRLILDSINKEKNDIYDAINGTGANRKSALIYGKLSAASSTYLAYSAYRVEVILKETAIIGVVGGAGLGWQLQESLSSFAWGEVYIITIFFSIITIVGEFLSDKLQNRFRIKDEALSSVIT